MAGPAGLELQPASRAAADSPPAPEPPVKDGAGQTGTKPSGQALGNGSSLTLVRSGEAAFNDHCTTCHDAEKSLALTKSLVEWQAVVRKMAKLDDADIPQNVHESIAVYLASRIAPQVAPQKDAGRTDKKPSDQAKGNAPDPALVRSGETAFSAHCTSCHNAEKSLTQTKSQAGWRANVRRMAEKDGANIPQNAWESIAAYLASRNASKGGGEGGGGSTADEGPPFSLTGTLAPLWRGGGSSDLEYPGFFGDVWAGVAWQGKGPLSAHVTACIACHAQQSNQVGRIELVEASVRLDVTKWLTSKCGAGCDPLLKTSVEMGRFVVPFGAFYQQVNPGLYRTVTAPLIYNMGQRVHSNDLGDPVLPMPYSDQGALVDLRLPLQDTLTATFHAYVVNGLQGGANGIDFFGSRSYTDNNSDPSVGGRLAISGKHLRLGASVMGGRFDSDVPGGPPAPALNYLIYGADAVFRWEDQLRVQFEYAQRDSDRPVYPTTIRDHVGGSYVEGELLLSRCWKLNLVARYDTQEYHSALPTGDFAVQRFTYGLNKTLPGGSTLMVNHEHWFLPGNLGDVDVIGIRWAAMF
ncbi:MAG: hypothetical protein NTY19_44580 [Planctomycetota bacterium]|nr:hypothetical protein [Planctomycetota bacterium]